MVTDEHMIQKPFAVVTGATDGLALETAKLFASKGFDLIITDRFEEIYQVRNELLQFGVFIEAHKIDLSNYKGVESLYAAIKAFGHPLDAFAFHAEEGLHGPFLDTKIEEEILNIRENVISPVHFLKRILKDMVERGHGRILITSTIGPPIEAPFEAVYGATKSFLYSITEAIRAEIKNEGITLTTLLPNLYDMPSDADMKILEDPEELARECFDALMSGRDHVFEASLRSKIQNVVTRFLPERAKNILLPS